MDFSRDNPGFSATPGVSQVAFQDSETLPTPSGSGSSASVPLSGGFSSPQLPAMPQEDE